MIILIQESYEVTKSTQHYPHCYYFMLQPKISIKKTQPLTLSKQSPFQKTSIHIHTAKLPSFHNTRASRNSTYLLLPASSYLDLSRLPLEPMKASIEHLAKWVQLGYFYRPPFATSAASLDTPTLIAVGCCIKFQQLWRFLTR